MHDALSPEGTAERALAYKNGRRPPMALVASLALARHTVLLDVAAAFATVLACLALTNVRQWANTRGDDADDDDDAVRLANHEPLDMRNRSTRPPIESAVHFRCFGLFEFNG